MQFLTNPDGSIPAGRIIPPNARLTRPTARPMAPDGYNMVDFGDGAQIDGVWYQKWTAVRVNVEIPQYVTPLQARRALRAVGLHAVVQTLMETAGEEAKEAWEYAVLVSRYDSMLISMASHLGLTDQQLDELFILAASM